MQKCPTEAGQIENKRAINQSFPHPLLPPSPPRRTPGPGRQSVPRLRQNSPGQCPGRPFILLQLEQSAHNIGYRAKNNRAKCSQSQCTSPRHIEDKHYCHVLSKDLDKTWNNVCVYNINVIHLHYKR